jgi:hypothetical protein
LLSRPPEKDALPRPCRLELAAEVDHGAAVDVDVDVDVDDADVDDVSVMLMRKTKTIARRG